ncbi:MAG: hypothetical protein A2Y91_02870 [Chloroflexi bacterium RBG_13_54_8]|nr:MAG: hypothetical protein A2Y91_02870 [Chloroflexi bacterium RBG_13_54_8]
MLEKLIYGARQLGLVLTPQQMQQFQLYYEELIEWNNRINLTAITDYEEVQLKHFLDSLTLVPVIQRITHAEGGLTLLDVGTGAGMPGLPLRIALPEVKVTLMDSVAKKTAFLQHLIDKLCLDYVNILTGRAEEMAHRPDYREKFDIVVSRAVTKLPTVVELTLPFCRVGGIAIAQKKGDIEEELSNAAKAMDILGGKTREIIKIALQLLEPRLIIVMEKVAATPTRYPRRAGMPEKRPL